MVGCLPPTAKCSQNQTYLLSLPSLQTLIRSEGSCCYQRLHSPASLLCSWPCQTFSFYYLVQKNSNSRTPCSIGLLKAIHCLYSHWCRLDWTSASYVDNGNGFFFSPLSSFLIQTILTSNKHSFHDWPEKTHCLVCSCCGIKPLLSLPLSTFHLWGIHRPFSLVPSTK